MLGLPTAQTIGVVAGVAVFSGTVLATLLLLLFGGSFKRMREQANAYQEAGPEAFKQLLKPRPELYNELLEAARSLPTAPQLADGVAELQGTHVVLRKLRKEDAQELFEASNGSPKFGHAYDADLTLWHLKPYGPYANAEELASSRLMNTNEPDSLRFKVVDRETNRAIGMCAILANRPSNLRARIGDMWMNPAYSERTAVAEVYFLLLDHLFDMNYRRVERYADAGDRAARKVLDEMGFFLEGVLRKHMIVKDCNRDTAVFAMLNSDWRDGRREALSKIIAGDGSRKESKKTKVASTSYSASRRETAHKKDI